jgi:hypothetical protein
MSVVFSVQDWNPADLYWQSAFTLVGGAGTWNLILQPVEGGDWVAWSVTQSDGFNAVVTISVGGNPTINTFGAGDGQVYSPADLPTLSPFQTVAVNGIGTPGETIFFNVLLRRTHRHDC